MPFDNYPQTPLEQPEHLDEPPLEGVIVVPYERLSQEALEAIIEEFVSREGTDYGDYQHSLADKVTQVLKQIKQGKAVVLFDPDTQNCHIELTTNVRPYLPE